MVFFFLVIPKYTLFNVCLEEEKKHFTLKMKQSLSLRFNLTTVSFLKCTIILSLLQMLAKFNCLSEFDSLSNFHSMTQSVTSEKSCVY